VKTIAAGRNIQILGAKFLWALCWFQISLLFHRAAVTYFAVWFSYVHTNL
jgi:hypothetical protein